MSSESRGQDHPPRLQTGRERVLTIDLKTGDLQPDRASDGQTAFEAEIARLIVGVLQLETTAEEIRPEERLFNEGLGLDSIDALELALAISRSYGLELKSDDERNQRIFASLRSLARHIETHRTR